MTATQSYYTFSSATGKEITVRAEQEDIARHIAMYNLWGPAYGWCHNIGTGLHLREVSESYPTKPEFAYDDGEDA